MGWCHGFGTERAAARHEPAHPQYASGAGDLLASRSRAFRDEARCWSEDDDPPRDERARRLRPRPRPRPRSRARHSARWTPRWISASFARRSTRIVARSPTRAEGGAHSCAARPRTSSSRSARARTVPGEPSRAWTPSRSSRPSRRWSDPRRTPAPRARARVPVVRIPERSWSLNPARARRRRRVPARRPANAPLIAPPLRTPTYVTAGRRKDREDARTP